MVFFFFLVYTFESRGRGVVGSVRLLPVFGITLIQ